MIRLREALGRRVMARDTAESVGQLHGAVVDATARRVMAVQVGKGHKARLVDWSAVTGMGPDAVVVDAEASLRAAQGEREEGVLKGDLPLLGHRVLTDRGDVLGALDDVELDETTGEVLTLLTGGETIPASRLRSLGGYAVVVVAESPTG